MTTDRTASHDAPRVLIADDEPDLIEALHFCLEQEGYEVRTACNGYEALGAVRAWQPHVVLLDVMMPGMDGFEVLKRIKTLAPNAVVIVVTGHGDKELTQKALDLNATDFINKPVQREALDAALKRAEEMLRNGSGRDKNS